MPSEWKNGMLEVSAGIAQFNFKKHLQTHHSIAPLFNPVKLFSISPGP
jgi:hypothetical protein